MKSSSNDYSKIPYLGKELRINILKTPFSFERIIEKNEELFIQIPAFTQRANSNDFLKQILGRWLKSQARRIFTEKATYFSARMGCLVNGIAIKDTKSRWGSCSSRGNLNFNWRVIMAPLPVVDYLVVHETAHLKEMNHSPRFWNLVSTCCPDYKNHIAWLRASSDSLFSW